LPAQSVLKSADAGVDTARGAQKAAQDQLALVVAPPAKLMPQRILRRSMRRRRLLIRFASKLTI